MKGYHLYFSLVFNEPWEWNVEIWGAVTACDVVFGVAINTEQWTSPALVTLTMQLF